MGNRGEGFFVRNLGPIPIREVEVCRLHGTPLQEKEVKHRSLWAIDAPSIKVCRECQKEKPRKQGRDQRDE